jgi:hypothetical protein
MVLVIFKTDGTDGRWPTELMRTWSDTADPHVQERSTSGTSPVPALIGQRTSSGLGNHPGGEHSSHLGTFTHEQLCEDTVDRNFSRASE